jgi:hypothetical protein
MDSQNHQLACDVSWWNTKLGALEELRKTFDRFKAAKDVLSRPGTSVSIELAASNCVDRHSELAKDFFRQILEVNWAWISDESELSDFHEDETNDRLIEKSRGIYGVNVSDISSGNLADIFDRITKNQAPTASVPSPE